MSDLVAVRAHQACPVCDETVSYHLPRHQALAYVSGALIQDAFPQLSPNDREELITGVHEYCDTSDVPAEKWLEMLQANLDLKPGK